MMCMRGIERVSFDDDSLVLLLFLFLLLLLILVLFVDPKSFCSIFYFFSFDFVQRQLLFRQRKLLYFTVNSIFA